MPEDIANFCVEFALKNGADYAEARIEKAKEESYILNNGTFEGASFSESSGIGIRVLANGGMGFSSLNSLNKEKIKLRIKEAVKMAKKCSKTLKKPIEFSDEKMHEDKWQVNEKENLFDISPEEKIKYLFEIEKSLSDLKEKLPSRYFSLNISKAEKFYFNSEGAKIFSILPLVALFAEINAKENGNYEQMNQGYSPKAGSGGWELIKKWNLTEKFRKEAETLIKILKEGKSLKWENRDIILAPQVVGIAMHESVGHPAEADRPLGREGAQAGETYMTKDWIGKRIGTSKVAVVDDPTIEGSYGFYLYDDEGIPAGERTLIKNGVLEGYLHNRHTAKIFGIKSNGAARASSYGREPIIRMSTTYMLPGDYGLEEMIREVKKGILVKSYTEWNIDDRRWNEKYVGSEAYLIEKGELKHLVKRPVLELTTKGFFSSVDACAKKKYLEFFSGTCGKGDPMQGIPVWMGGPYIRLKNIHIGSQR